MVWSDPATGSWSITLTWRRVSERYECVGFALNQPAPGTAYVTAALVRSVPVGRLIEETRRIAGSVAENLAAGYTDADMTRGFEGIAAGFKTPAGGRPRMYDDEHYRNVAAFYAAAWRGSAAPTKFVETTYGVSHSTAARWVHESRKRGFLGATDERRAGGVLPPDTEEGT